MILTKEHFKVLGMNVSFDKSLLPDNYQYVEMPLYKGDGELSVNQLETLVKQFVEYTHQQRLIKAELLEHILDKELATLKIIDKINEIQTP